MAVTVGLAIALGVPLAGHAQQATPGNGGAVDYLWGLCEPFTTEPPPTALTTVAGDERVHIESDQADMHLELTSVYRGNAHAQFGTTHLEADILRYDPKHETLQAEGNVRLTHDGDLFLRGSSAKLLLGTEQGTFEDANFRMYSTHSLGTASSIEAPDPDTLLLRKASYTTCNQPKPAWSLTSSKIKLDKIEKQGSATNVLLRAKGVPIFYWPYIRFPLTEERLTGFLFPSIGVSNKTGTDLRVPFYWNIAPSMDMTITPRYMSKRGLMLENEYRYLTRINGGELDFGYLPDDEQFGDDRGYFSWKHNGSPLRGWSTSFTYNYVSDDQYLEDLGGDLSSASLTSLDRIGEVRYDAASWSTSLRVQDFQTLSGTSPYSRMPQYLFDLRLPARDGKVNYHFNTELVRFDHSDRVPTGGRYDFQGGLSLPWRHPAAYVTPKLIVRHTQYDLEDTSAGQEEKPARTLPVASIDSGIFLERNTSAGNTPLIHTLEPRLKYLYIPERDQADLPLFDTAQTTPSFSRLFEDYVFTGPDRIADANRIAAALTSRVLHERTGAELVRGSIGQSYELKTRPDVPSTSNIFLELTGRPAPGWAISANMEYDPHVEVVRKSDFRVQFRPRRDNLVHVAHRFERDVLENWEAGIMWRVTPRWQIITRGQYDIVNKRTTEAIYGFQYESCCWAVRLVGRNYVTDDGLGRDDSVYLEVVLKGLSSLGGARQIEELLERGILQ